MESVHVIRIRLAMQLLLDPRRYRVSVDPTQGSQVFLTSYFGREFITKRKTHKTGFGVFYFGKYFCHGRAKASGSLVLFTGGYNIEALTNLLDQITLNGFDCWESVYCRTDTYCDQQLPG